MIQWHVANWTEWPPFLFSCCCEYSGAYILNVDMVSLFVFFLSTCWFCRSLKIDVKQQQMYNFGKIQFQCRFLSRIPWADECSFYLHIIHNRRNIPRLRNIAINYTLSQNLHKTFIQLMVQSNEVRCLKSTPDLHASSSFEWINTCGFILSA